MNNPLRHVDVVTAAYARAGLASAEMERYYMRDMRVQHLHQLYDANGKLIPTEPSSKSEEEMFVAYKNLEATKKNAESQFAEYALQQDMFTARFHYVGERLVNVANRSDVYGMICYCMESSGRFTTTPTVCAKCEIPANVLTTIANPSYISVLVDKVYLVCYAHGGLVQICASNARKITLSWSEVAFVVWCAFPGTLCKDIFKSAFAIPVGSQKQIVVDVPNDKYVMKGPGGVIIELGTFNALRTLQEKCREFAFRCDNIADLAPFIPSFFFGKGVTA